MEYVVLGLLILKSLTLYELNQAFKHSISLFYSASYGSLQAAVKNLLAKGWATFEERVENGRNKKAYSITPAGQAAFFAWMLEPIPPSKLEVTALARVYFLGLLPDVEARRQVLREILARIEQVESELAALEANLRRLDLPPAYQTVFHYQMKTLDYGRQSHRFGRAWFEALLAELNNR